jgi:hypothetical protein
MLIRHCIHTKLLNRGKSLSVGLCLSLSLSLFLLLSAGPARAQDAEAGRVLMALGDVKVSRAGATIALKKGDAVRAGDTIITGPTSNAQVRMSDGAIMAIRSQTEFKINEYSFNGKADGTEKASLSLVKGGVRAVTGVIGRENKDNLKVDAVVATIGIRGTGFNIVYCQGNCSNADKTPAKDGLYAGVFEGKVSVANERASGVYGVNEPVLVESKTSSIARLKQIPDFLRDPLAGQVIVPKKAESVVNPVEQAVQVPQESADNVGSATSALAQVSGVVINPPPDIAFTLSGYDGVYYNKPGQGSGSPVATTSTGVYFLQLAESFPGSVGSGDGLPYHNVSPVNNAPLGSNYQNPGYWGAKSTGTTTADYPNELTLYSAPPPATTVATVRNLAADGTVFLSSPDIYKLGPNGTQVEGGTFNGIVSWGRWAGEVQQVGGYNNGLPITYPAGSGFSYVIGSLTPASQLQDFNTNRSVLNFTLLGATSPGLVSNPDGSWIVTSGNLTANFASSAISGNLAMTTTQSAGYGNYNMGFSGPLGTAASNTVTTSFAKTSGTLTTCTTACNGTGNVSFYGTNAAAAGLSYNVNTGTNVLQGVAVFKQ